MVNRAIAEMVDIAKRYYLIDCHVDVATDITYIAYYGDLAEMPFLPNRRNTGSE